MALLFMDGFDHYTSLADFLKKWTDGSANCVISDSYARIAGRGNGMYVAGANTTIATKVFAGNYSGGVIGFAFSLPSVASKTLLSVMDGTTEQISIRTTAVGVLAVNQGGTQKAVGSAVLSPNTWYYGELKYTIHGSAGVVELHLNGATEIASTSSLDTTGTANAYWNGFTFGVKNSANGLISIDDLYVLQTDSGANVDFFGPSRIVVCTPSGAGSSAEWDGNYADNWQNVCDRIADGDATFNQSATAEQIDLFGMSDVPAGTVHAIQQVIYARQDAGAQRVIRPVIRIGGTNYNGSSVNLAASYLMYLAPSDVSPATGGATAWDDDELNGAEFGYELVS